MNKLHHRVPDLLKATGMVIGVYLASLSVAMAVESLGTFLIRTSTENPPDLTGVPLLFIHMTGVFAAILCIEPLREYRMVSRVLAGGLAGFTGTSLALHLSPALSNGTLLTGTLLVAAICASLGKNDGAKQVGAPTAPRA